MRRCTSMLLACLALVAVTGCSSGVTRPDGGNAGSPYFTSADRQARTVTVALDPKVVAKLGDNSSFQKSELQARIRSALGDRNMLAAGEETSLPTIEVTVTDIRARSTLAAVMAGFLAGDDRIVGDVIVLDDQGRKLQHFTVKASYALGGLAGGPEATRMGWLYDKFAQHTVAELTGSAKSK